MTGQVLTPNIHHGHFLICHSVRISSRTRKLLPPEVYPAGSTHFRSSRTGCGCGVCMSVVRQKISASFLHFNLFTQPRCQNSYFENVSIDLLAKVPNIHCKHFEMHHFVHISSMLKSWPPVAYRAYGSQIKSGKSRKQVRFGVYVWIHQGDKGVFRGRCNKLLILQLHSQIAHCKNYEKCALCKCGYCNRYKLKNLTARHISLAQLCFDSLESKDHIYHVQNKRTWQSQVRNIMLETKNKFKLTSWDLEGRSASITLELSHLGCLESQNEYHLVHCSVSGLRPLQNRK